MKLRNLLISFTMIYSGLALSASSEADKALGTRLKDAQSRGLLIVEGTARPQIDQLIRQGFIKVNDKELHISEGMHTFLNALLDNAEAQNKTFGIMSLAADRGPHGGNGEAVTRAVDLSLFNNYSLRVDRYSGVQLALLDLLDILPDSEKYNIGLPRTAYKVGETLRTCGGVQKDGNACDKARYSYRIAADVFAHPEQYEFFLAAKYNEKWPVRTPNKSATADLAFIQNVTYRDALIDATEAAVQRGVKFSGWFADSLDHLHVAVDTHKQALP